MIVHLEMLKSRCTYYENFWSLRICALLCVKLSAMITRLSTYVMMLHVANDVLKWYHVFSFLHNEGLD